MNPDGNLVKKIKSGDFIVTAEYLPRVSTQQPAGKDIVDALSNGLCAVNVSDNPYCPTMSSIAASVALSRAGIEPVLQIITRDRNRIALQSDLLGAAYLGIKNVLCLSGYHQTLTGSIESANVYDIDSIQLVAVIKKMHEEGTLLDGSKFDGEFSMLAGATANPYLTPLELNLLSLAKKVDAGAGFIQTKAVFDTVMFNQWLETARNEGITEKTSILAGVLPLKSATEAEMLRDTFSDFRIPDEVIERLKAAGNADAQKKEGVVVCSEIILKLKEIDGLRGIHILSGGNETVVPELLAVSGLS
ncbi:methylenetetrahydrofolate reductase [Candidatus Latescibacterota bacterium]